MLDLLYFVSLWFLSVNGLFFIIYIKSIIYRLLKGGDVKSKDHLSIIDRLLKGDDLKSKDHLLRLYMTYKVAYDSERRTISYFFRAFFFIYFVPLPPQLFFFYYKWFKWNYRMMDKIITEDNTKRLFENNAFGGCLIFASILIFQGDCAYLSFLYWRYQYISPLDYYYFFKYLSLSCNLLIGGLTVFPYFQSFNAFLHYCYNFDEMAAIFFVISRYTCCYFLNSVIFSVYCFFFFRFFSMINYHGFFLGLYKFFEFEGAIGFNKYVLFWNYLTSSF